MLCSQRKVSFICFRSECFFISIGKRKAIFFSKEFVKVVRFKELLFRLMIKVPLSWCGKLFVWKQKGCTDFLILEWFSRKTYLFRLLSWILHTYFDSVLLCWLFSIGLAILMILFHVEIRRNFHVIEKLK